MDHHREEDQPEDKPVCLVPGQLVSGFRIQPVEHDQPDRGQQGDHREEIGVGIRQADTDVDMSGETDRQEVEPVGEAQVGELIVILREDCGKAQGQKQGNRDKGEQFPVAGGAHPEMPSRASMSSTSEVASSSERIAWSVTDRCRLAGNEVVCTADEYLSR